MPTRIEQRIAERFARAHRGLGMTVEAGSTGPHGRAPVKVRGETTRRGRRRLMQAVREHQGTVKVVEYLSPNTSRRRILGIIPFGKRRRARVLDVQSASMPGQKGKGRPLRKGGGVAGTLAGWMNYSKPDEDWCQREVQVREVDSETGLGTGRLISRVVTEVRGRRLDQKPDGEVSRGVLAFRQLLSETRDFPAQVDAARTVKQGLLNEAEATLRDFEDLNNGVETLGELEREPFVVRSKFWPSLLMGHPFEWAQRSVKVWGEVTSWRWSKGRDNVMDIGTSEMRIVGGTVRIKVDRSPLDDLIDKIWNLTHKEGNDRQNSIFGSVTLQEARGLVMETRIHTRNPDAVKRELQRLGLEVSNSRIRPQMNTFEGLHASDILPVENPELTVNRARRDAESERQEQENKS